MGQKYPYADESTQGCSRDLRTFLPDAVRETHKHDHCQEETEGICSARIVGLLVNEKIERLQNCTNRVNR